MEKNKKYMEKKKKNKRKNIGKKTRIILTLFFFLFIIFILLRVAEIKSLIRILTKINPFWLILAIFIQYLSFLIMSIFMHEMLLDMKTKIKISFLTKLNIAASFVDVVLPSQGISAGVFIFKLLGKQNISKGKRAILLFFTFIINYFVYFLLLIISTIYFYLYFKNLEITIGLSLFLLILFLFFLFFVFIFLKDENFIIKTFDRLPLKFINRFIKDFENRGREVLIEFYKERKKYKFDFYRYGLLMFLSYICRILVLFFIALSLNYNLSFDKAIIAFMFSSFISLVSYIKLGFFELGLVIALLGVGIEYNLALTTTLLFRLVSFWIPFVFGYIFFRKIMR